MRRTTIFALGFAALVSTPVLPVFAADTAAGSLTQESADQWRASKLPGVNIYGPGDKKVGSISDVLVGKDGKSEYIIVGVGGFLGIGQKDVAIPFDQVKFTDKPVRMATADATGTAIAPGTGGGVGAAPGTTTGTGAPAGTGGGMTGALGSGAAMAPGQTAMAANGGPMSYPDHGMIDLTADQLKAAPAFTFAK